MTEFHYVNALSVLTGNPSPLCRFQSVEVTPMLLPGAEKYEKFMHACHAYLKTRGGLIRSFQR